MNGVNGARIVLLRRAGEQASHLAGSKGYKTKRDNRATWVLKSTQSSCGPVRKR